MDHTFSSGIPWNQHTESNSNKTISMRCVTIPQILRLTPESCNISCGMLMLVGNVYRESIDSQGCRWYGFDDGLGKIDGYKRQAEGDFIFEPFAYARIIGESDHRGDKKLLKVFHIEPVYEAHEIFHHLLCVIMDTLIAERGPPPIDHNLSSSSSPTSLNSSQERMNYILASLQEISFSDNSSVGISEGQGHISDSEDDFLPDTAPRFMLSILQTDIIACISMLQVEAGGDIETGVHITSIVQEIRSRYPNLAVPEFFAAMEQLLRENFIHNTTDDEHYACHNPSSP